MIRFSLSSLRLRLLLLVLLAVVPALALIIYNAAEQRGLALSEVETEALEVARQAARSQSQYFEQARQILVRLAEVPDVRRAAQTPCSDVFDDLQTQYLQQYPRYANLGTIDLNGNILCSVLPLGGLANIAGQAHFDRALQTLQFTIGPYEVDGATGRTTVTVVYPVVDFAGNQAQAVLFAALDLSWLEQLAAEAQLPEGSTFTVIDQDGTLLLRYPDPGDGVGQVLPETSVLAALQAQGGDGTTQAVDAEGLERLYAFAPLGSHVETAHVSIGIPARVVFTQADQVLARSLLTLSVVTVLVLAVAWYGSEVVILRQVRALVQATERLSAGDLSSRTGLPEDQGEISQLALAFDQMAVTLEQRERERQQAEIARRASEERYRTLIQNFPNGAVILYDRDLRYTIADGTGLADIGLSREMLEGKTMWELFPPETCALLEPHFRAALAGIPASFEIPLSQRMYVVYTLPIRNERGEVFAGMVMTQDITERKQAEEDLQASEARNRALLNALPDLMFRVSRDGTYLDYHVQRASDMSVPLESLVGTSIRDTAQPPELKDKFLSAIAAALETGQMQVLEYSAWLPDGLHHDEARVVASGPDEVVAIVRDITERKRAEAALARWAQIFEHADWGVVAGSAESRTLDLMNPAYARMHGYTVAELMDKPIASVYAPGAQHELDNLIQFADEKGHAVIETEHARKDGTIFPVQVDLTSVRDEAGKVLYRIANVQDITERKRADEALAKWAHVFEHAELGIAVRSADSRAPDMINPAYAKMHGYTVEELASKPASVVFAPGTHGELTDLIQVANETGHAVIESRHIRKDGTIFPVLVDLTAVKDHTGRLLYRVAYVQDITERKQAEAALREREEQYRSVFDSSTDGLFINDLEGHLVDFNPAAAHMHGYTVEEFRQLQPPQFIHPDSLPLFREYMETVNAGRTFRARAVDVRKDGTPLHVEVLGTAFTYRGQPHTLGVVRDITEQVQSYQLLEQRVEERTRELTTLLDISRNVASTLELQPLLGLILDQLHAVMEYSGATIFTLQGDELAILDYRGPITAEQARRIRFSLSQAAANRAVIEQREPVIIGDVRGDTPLARAFQAAAGAELDTTYAYVHCWMGVPLMIKEWVIGMLSLDHGVPHYYTPHHARLALAIASQAAIAIENARLYEQAQALAAMEERQKLARELHDSVSQALYGIALGARTARTMLDRAPAAEGAAPPALAEPLDYVLLLAEAGLAEMRALIFELRPESLQLEGLVAALTKQAASLRARHSLDVHARLGEEPDVPLEVKEALYRIAQEALHNTVKHARARQVDVWLDQTGQGVTLELRDDGQGFDAHASFPGHLGLQSMRERATRLGGTLEIESAPGQGTRIRVHLPRR